MRPRGQLKCVQTDTSKIQHRYDCACKRNEDILLLLQKGRRSHLFQQVLSNSNTECNYVSFHRKNVFMFQAASRAI